MTRPRVNRRAPTATFLRLAVEELIKVRPVDVQLEAVMMRAPPGAQVPGANEDTTPTVTKARHARAELLRVHVGWCICCISIFPRMQPFQSQYLPVVLRSSGFACVLPG